MRVDFNVPMSGGKVLEDTRLRASLPTIEFLIKQKAKVIIVTHLGRPDGKNNRKLKLDIVAKKLAEILGSEVKKLSGYSGLAVEKEIETMRGGQVVMLENIRFSTDEEKNTGTLAKDLSALGDVFVLDGFAVAHRAAASVVGINKFLPSYAGLLLASEINSLDKVLKNGKKPFVVIVGGAKVETKVPVIKNLLPKADNILIGGGLFNTYLKAAKYRVGQSVLNDKFKKEMLVYGKKRKLVLPVDVVVGDLAGKKYRLVDIQKKPHQVCGSDEYILDIGPRSIRLFVKYIKNAQTLLWNGAVGYFEKKPYDTGTTSVARLVASRSKGKAFGVIGGGETIQVMEMVGMSEHIDFVSTGGGAMLEYLSGKELPGIGALK